MTTIKSFLFVLYSKWKSKRLLSENLNGIYYQNKIRIHLIQEASHTEFGVEHQFDKIHDYHSFKSKIPLRSYEDFIPYIHKIQKGNENILWKGLPLYLAKTSGTTAKIKYIPISKDAINFHINAARNVLVFHTAQTNTAKFLEGKMIFLQGSPALEYEYKVPTGRLSGIVYHHVPKFFLSNRIPSYVTNCIEDWEEKINAIIKETKNINLNLISGIPPWCIMFFEKLLNQNNKNTIQEIFPSLSLFIHGGVNFNPYEEKIKKLLGNNIPILETYPASEGFIAYQFDMHSKNLLLNINAGIFYEFIELENYNKGINNTITLESVKTNVQYVLIISTNSGLWRYIIGDTIKFKTLKLFTITVTGRIKQFISAFGEHVIAEEIEIVMRECIQKFNLDLVEFHVCPNMKNNSYAWYLEINNEIIDTTIIANFLHQCLAEKNIYYMDLVEGKIINTPTIHLLRKNSFFDYQKKIGKLGGQNKIVRIANETVMAESLMSIQ